MQYLFHKLVQKISQIIQIVRKLSVPGLDSGTWIFVIFESLFILLSQIPQYSSNYTVTHQIGKNGFISYGLEDLEVPLIS